MVIKELAVKNFRSLLNESLSCDALTALVGRNGCGKSSFLRALELFYDSSAKVSSEDFYAEDASEDIEIAVTFADLSADESEFFSAYTDNGTLTVTRVFAAPTGRRTATYHGTRLQNPEFNDVRAAGGKREITTAYNELVRTEKYSSLPQVRSADQALDSLSAWEREHPAECTRLRDDGQFFGFTEVGQGYLGRHTRFIRIPAVRDAADDAAEGRGACITEIMDLVVRSVLASREEVTTFKQDTQSKYKEILDPSRLSELGQLEQQLTGTLKSFAPDASVWLQWAELAEISVPMPQASVRLSEDGYRCAVNRTGHGLQRAFILTLLQHLVAARATPPLTEAPGSVGGQPAGGLPNLVLAIEEPELYQHPSRQRHLASILFQLALGSIPGVARNTQVIYSTHSPLLVGLDRFDRIRLLRKEDFEPGRPKITRVTKAVLGAVAKELGEACGQPDSVFTAERLRARLQAIMTPWMNEGFFADIVVLVEGEEDRAAILATAACMAHDFDSAGIAVIPCMGKNNLDRPLVIFRQLGIPTYVIWDSDFGDHDAKPEPNHRLLHLVGATQEDWPSAVEDRYACFRTNLGSVLSQEIGQEFFDERIAGVMTELGIHKKKDAQKNPLALRQTVEAATTAGREAATLKRIVEKVAALRPAPTVTT